MMDKDQYVLPISAPHGSMESIDTSHISRDFDKIASDIRSEVSDVTSISISSDLTDSPIDLSFDYYNPIEDTYTFVAKNIEIQGAERILSL